MATKSGGEGHVIEIGYACVLSLTYLRSGFSSESPIHITAPYHCRSVNVRSWIPASRGAKKHNFGWDTKPQRSLQKLNAPFIERTQFLLTKKEATVMSVHTDSSCSNAV